MAGATRDRVTVDLRGIGDAVRDAARTRSITIAALARQALVDAVGKITSHTQVLDLDGFATPRPTVKLTLRLPGADAERLVLSAGSLGLSYGAYVARLVSGIPLPQPAADRTADRAALLASSDHLATLSADLNALMRRLRLAQSAEAAAYRQRISTVDTEIRQHLERAAAFISSQ
jgi:hypothetical protein